MTPTETIRISRFAAPVTALGPGTRVALWVQGCTIGCTGCASRDTWSSSGGVEWDVAELAVELCRVAADTGASGLTVTGGEPFQQPGAVAAVVAHVRDAWKGVDPVDVLVFTGYAHRAAQRLSPVLWDSADIVIAGPYRRDRPSDHPLLGSANQTITAVTVRGERTLRGTTIGAAHMQVTESEGDLFLTGMPNPGDLDALRIRLAERGIHFSGVSWQDDPAEEVDQQ